MAIKVIPNKFLMMFLFRGYYSLLINQIAVEQEIAKGIRKFH